MRIVPSSLLSGLYDRDSLVRVQNGFTFGLHNTKATGVTITRILPLKVDGRAWPVEAMSLIVDGRTIKAENINECKPFSVPAGAEVMVQVMGLILDDQPHRFVLPVEARHLGRLELSFTDELDQGAKQETKPEGH